MENPFAIRNARKERAKLNCMWWCPLFASPSHERKDSEAKRRQRQLSHSAVPTGPAAPGAPGAHLSAFHRGSRPKESFIARDSASGFCFLGRGGKVGGPSVEWALPAPTCPSPARPSRPGHSARRITPSAARERVASPPAGTALARATWECLPGRVRKE